MGADRLRPALLGALALVCLVAGAEAQARGKPKPKKQRAAAAQAPPVGGLPPFLRPAQEKPKKPAAAPASKPPDADPMEAADLVTAGADLRAAREVELGRILRAHYRVCDLDANGWISLREAEVLLSFDREEYRRFDADQDGRLVLEEFVQHQEVILARLGAVPQAPELAPSAPGPEDPAAGEPVSKLRERSELRTMFPRPADLLGRYDADASQGLDTAELEKLCAEVGLELSTELIAAQMDPNGSGQLEVSELVPLAWVVSRSLPGALSPTLVASDVPADLLPSGATSAPTVLFRTHFALLDLSQDGAIDESDLRSLQSPARLDVRLETVLSALDRDGDRRLSEDEFYASMSNTRGTAAGSH